jgi:hypothetical protein
MTRAANAENVKPTWVPAGRNQRAWEPLQMEEPTPRKAPRPVASGISFREGDLGDARVVDLIKVCDFYEAKASGKYATPVACGRYVHDLAREVRAVAVCLREGASQHSGRVGELEKICREWDQYFGPTSDAAGRLDEDQQQGFLGMTPLTPAALHEERIWLKDQLREAQKRIIDAERGGDTRALKAEKALGDFQRLSRDAASRARAAHDLELQAQARDMDATYAGYAAAAASDVVHVDPTGAPLDPRKPVDPKTGRHPRLRNPKTGVFVPRPRTPVERVQAQAVQQQAVAQQQQAVAHRKVYEEKKQTAKAKKETTSVKVELQEIKAQLQVSQQKAQAMAGTVADVDTYADTKVSEALQAARAARRARCVDADCQTGPCGSLRFAHAPRGPRAITSRQVLVRECPLEIDEDVVARQVSHATGVALLQCDRRSDLDTVNTYALEVLCATPEDACKLVHADGTVTARQLTPSVIPEPAARPDLALAPTPIEVVNLDLSPYALPAAERSRSRSPIEDDPFVDFEDVLGHLSSIKPVSSARRPFR